MKKITRKKHLEMRIQSIPSHPKPKVELEQYATPSDIASDLLWNALSLGDIENKNVLDLGCGCGIFSIGSALLGAKSVIGVDIDEDSINLARKSADKFDVENVDFIVRDICDLTNDLDVDTIFQNPPFGSQKRADKGIDLKFVKKAYEFKPDVILGIMYKCSLYGKLASIGTGIPVIQTEHNSFERPSSAPMSSKDKFLKFYVNKIFDAVTVLTEADKKSIDNRLKNVYVMPNPLALQPAESVPQKKKIILSSGRLDSWHVKGFDLLFQAWSKIEKKHPDWDLQVAGWGSKQSTIDFVQQLAKYAGCVNRIQLLGFREDIVNLYKESSIFVLSSRYEGFGLVLIEAMSQGCACVACDYKGRQKEILCPEGVSSFRSQDSSLEICENGILCEPDNVEALAMAMDKMISDEELRRKIQENGIERSKYYSIDNTIARWEALINKVVNKA